MWFTENGRDFYSHDWPPDEINVVTEEKQDFGFPYVYGNQSVDKEVTLPPSFNIDDYKPASYELEPHAAALGMTFYTGNMFPQKYRNGFFVAEHGNRKKIYILHIKKIRILEFYRSSWIQNWIC